jgi:hypothetical protein
MDEITTRIQRLIEHPPQMWAVVLAALVLAWLEGAVKLGRTHRYDAWWLFNLRGSQSQFLRRPRR